jgi:hypothetical protein
VSSLSFFFSLLQAEEIQFDISDLLEIWKGISSEINSIGILGWHFS